MSNEQNINNKVRNLSLTQEEVTIVFNGLAELPGKVAYNTMKKIESQIIQQIQAEQAEKQNQAEQQNQDKSEPQ